jgi:hypothetical protein
MDKQPEALRLADALDRAANYELKNYTSQAAIELRRLHAANLDCIAWFYEVKRERDELLKALRDIENRTVDGGTVNGIAHAAIAKAGVTK